MKLSINNDFISQVELDGPRTRSVAVQVTGVKWSVHLLPRPALCYTTRHHPALTLVILPCPPLSCSISSYHTVPYPTLPYTTGRRSSGYLYGDNSTFQIWNRDPSSIPNLEYRSKFLLLPYCSLVNDQSMRNCYLFFHLFFYLYYVLLFLFEVFMLYSHS